MTPTRWTEEKKNLSTDSLIARGIYGNANDRNCSGSAYDSTPCLSALPYCLYTINLPLIPLSGISYENVECSGLLSFSNASEGVLALHTDHTGLQHFSFSPQSAEWSRCCHAILSSRKWLFSHLWVCVCGGGGDGGGWGGWKNLIMLSYEYEVETSVELWTFFLSDIEARTKSEH